MGTRSTWAAWTMLAIFVVGCGTAVTLEVTADDFGADAVTLYLAFTGFMVVGAVIVARRPDNRIGWIFSAIGLLAATGTLATEYATYAYITGPGSGRRRRADHGGQRDRRSPDQHRAGHDPAARDGPRSAARPARGKARLNRWRLRPRQPPGHPVTRNPRREHRLRRGKHHQLDRDLDRPV